MNLTQLEKQIGRQFRLRPTPLNQEDEKDLKQADDKWKLIAILDKPSRIQLSNIRTIHSVELGSDNVREYRSPDFLLLRCQITITLHEVLIEPIISNSSGTTIPPTESEIVMYERIERLMPQLLTEMRNDLAEFPTRREFVLLKRSWSYWAKGTELVYYLDEHDDLEGKMQILVNYDLIKEITYNNVKRFVISEQLARYLGA